jgi:hypothetical protein
MGGLERRAWSARRSFRRTCGAQTQGRAHDEPGGSSRPSVKIAPTASTPSASLRGSHYVLDPVGVDQSRAMSKQFARACKGPYSRQCTWSRSAAVQCARRSTGKGSLDGGGPFFRCRSLALDHTGRRRFTGDAVPGASADDVNEAEPTKRERGQGRRAKRPLTLRSTRARTLDDEPPRAVHVGGLAHERKNPRT